MGQKSHFYPKTSKKAKKLRIFDRFECSFPRGNLGKSRFLKVKIGVFWPILAVFRRKRVILQYLRRDFPRGNPGKAE